MSYILEALKKSQTDNRNDEVAFSVSAPRNRRLPPWIIVMLAFALVANGALWIFIFGDSGPSAQQQTTPNTPETSATQIDSLTVQRLPSPQSESVDPPAQPSAAIQAALDRSPVVQPSSDRTPTPAQAAPAQDLQTYTLDDLPSDERQFFVDFNYTSHIYTDDQALCAIVVNGERLQTGSRFSGLVVQEITPEGLVFEQSTAVGKRLVAISLIDQWSY